MSQVWRTFAVGNGYPVSLAVALAVHGAFLAGILYWQALAGQGELELIQPQVVTALFVAENPQQLNRRELELRQQEAASQRRRERQAAAEQEAERQAALVRRRELEDAQRQALIARQQLESQRAQDEREARRQREEELAAQREAQRQRELAAAEQERERLARQEEERRRSQDADERELAAARNEFELVQSAAAIIRTLVETQWSRPPSARNGMRARLRIGMLPTGEVTGIDIIESSTDPAFDRAAENAVYRAAPFAELRDLPIDVFNREFRSFVLVFQPEDLLN